MFIKVIHTQIHISFETLPAASGATPAALFHGLSQKVLPVAPAGQLCFALKSHSLYKVRSRKEESSSQPNGKGDWMASVRELAQPGMFSSGLSA